MVKGTHKCPGQGWFSLLRDPTKRGPDHTGLRRSGNTRNPTTKTRVAETATRLGPSGIPNDRAELVQNPNFERDPLDTLSQRLQISHLILFYFPGRGYDPKVPAHSHQATPRFASNLQPLY